MTSLASNKPGTLAGFIYLTIWPNEYRYDWQLADPRDDQLRETMASTTIPRIPGIDHTLAFMRDGYDFISNRCDQLGADMFRARLMLRPVTCVRGASAAEMFYDGDRFTRRGGAMPPTVLRLLQDKGSVQQLDDKAHRHRKALFADMLMTEEAEANFITIFRTEWFAKLVEWEKRPSIVLFDEAAIVLTRAVCQWMGVPLNEKTDSEMTFELNSMVENAGGFGPKMFLALARRRQSERFIIDLIDHVRAETDFSRIRTPIGRIAHFRDEDGRGLSTEAAAVEVLNILRPTVAVSRYIMFAALALHQHSEWHAALKGAAPHLYENFAEEVRRLYPFFPLIGGIARHDFEWQGIRFARGDWVLLDLHGTNHDPRRFTSPYRFNPERARSWRDQDCSFIPQGGGRTRESHRCPGEQFTVAAIREAVSLLVEEMQYEVPAQDLSMPLHRMPARPKSGMVLAKIRRL